MSRLDPQALPDRFEIEAHARQLRREEIARLARAFTDWLGAFSREHGALVRANVAPAILRRPG